MKKKIKEFAKSYLIGLILGIVVSGTISVIAATYFPSNDVSYDNTQSGLQSTTVKGAIDELYTECTKEPTAGETIIENAGLEKDPYECRYFFTGANPNNYITFNNETADWRIISVECDGTIKIMRIIDTGSRVWDNIGNNWTRPATLNTYLNSIYYNELNSTAQSQIVTHNFSIGSVTEDNNDLTDQVNKENETIWSGKIALPTVSEYLRTNSNISCKTLNLNNSNYNTCKNTTWMNKAMFTLSPHAGNNLNIFSRYADGRLRSGSATSTLGPVMPTLYLSSEVKITGGTGTSSDPYEISL